MKTTKNTSPDFLFWVGGGKAMALLNYTTAKAHAIITQNPSTGGFRVHLPLNLLHRFRLWRSMTPGERRRTEWFGGVCMNVELDHIWEAVTETDQILESLGVIPDRVEPLERFYFIFRQLSPKPKFAAWSCPSGDDEHDQYLVTAGDVPIKPCSICGRALHLFGS